MCKSLKRENSSRKGTKSELLLAPSPQGCRVICLEVLEMPNAHADSALPAQGDDIYHFPLVIQTVGTRHYGSDVAGKGWHKIHPSSGGLLQEVGGGRVLRDNKCRQYNPVPVEGRGVPASNTPGIQFDSDDYRNWCKELGIKAKYSSLGHLQANIQAKATNKTLVGILEKRLTSKK